jgi:ornithine lipid hydroxylase
MRFWLWPLVVFGSMGVALAEFGFGWPAGLVVFVASTVNVLAVFALEHVYPRERQPGLFRDPQSPNDIAHGVLVASISRTLAGPLALVALGAAGRVGSWRLRDLWWPGSWPFAAQVVLGLAVFSFVGYWTHRWYHTVGWLWSFHLLHHDASELQVLKANRIHLGEDVVRQWCALVPLYLLGVPAHVLIWMALWNNFEGSIAHANVDCRFPRWAHRVLPTPQNHLLHHAANRTYQQSNYAGVTPLWDALFGTYRHPLDHRVTAFGVADARMPRRFLAQLAYPFHRAPS